MRPHTHTHDVRHTRLPLSPRTSKPKSKLRVKRVCPACCAECVTAPARGRPGVRSGRRTRHTTRTATDPSQTATQTQTRRADTRTQTRRRAPRTKQGTTARCGSVPASFATASLATYMPWYCPPRLLDLQLPRRRQTSSDVDFRFMDPVCAREAHTVRSVCGAVPTRGATWRYQQPGVHACLHLRCQPGALLRPAQKPARATPRATHRTHAGHLAGTLVLPVTRAPGCQYPPPASAPAARADTTRQEQRAKSKSRGPKATSSSTRPGLSRSSQTRPGTAQNCRPGLQCNLSELAHVVVLRTCLNEHA